MIIIFFVTSPIWSYLEYQGKPTVDPQISNLGLINYKPRQKKNAFLNCEMGSGYAAQPDFKLTTLLLQSPEPWDYKLTTLCQLTSCYFLGVGIFRLAYQVMIRAWALPRTSTLCSHSPALCPPRSFLPSANPFCSPVTRSPFLTPLTSFPFPLPF